MLYKLLLIGFGCIIGVIFAIATVKIATVGKVWKIFEALFVGIVSRIDRLLTGNDGNYSHTRFLNIMWGIGNFALVCIAILRNIKIPEGILVLMGAGMGINMTGSVLNKIQEIKDSTNAK